jgi:hypothetical protein
MLSAFTSARVAGRPPKYKRIVAEHRTGEVVLRGHAQQFRRGRRITMRQRKPAFAFWPKRSLPTQAFPQ